MKTFTLALCAFASLLQYTSLYPQLQLNCDNDSTGLIPLTDLGTDYYGNFQGDNDWAPIIMEISRGDYILAAVIFAPQHMARKD